MNKNKLLIFAIIVAAAILLICCAACFAGYSRRPQPLKPLWDYPQGGIGTLDIRY